MYQGISISADQPSASLLVACRQLPSQSLLNWLPLVTTASYTPSVELTVKLYPVQPSPSKSTIRLTRSTCPSKTRCPRWLVRGTDARCRLRQPTATPSGVPTTTASAGSDAHAPYRGCPSRKYVPR